MRLVTVLLSFLFSFNAFSQDDSMLGNKSPELIFENILNFEKETAKLSDFKGKVVILDFWATWCAPCIESFPHLEKLQTKFGEELQIITITDDPEARITRFLDNRKMNFPILIDEKRELAKVFPHVVIPHTVVIDQSGTVKVIATPYKITEDLIKKILLDQEVNVEEKKDVRNFDPSLPLSGNENLTYQITITPYTEGYPTFSNDKGGAAPYTGRRILVTNLSARALFEIAHQFPPRIRTIVEVSDLSKFEWSKENAICFDIIVPEALGEQRFDIMRQQLSIYYGYQTFVEERMMPVTVLQRITGTKILITESEEGTEPYSNDNRNRLSMKGSPIEKLADFLEDKIHKPAVNETNLSGLYDLEIPWYNEKPEQIHEELKKIGLEIIDAERKIEVLVIKDK